MAKILIADDDIAILESTSALLELYGHDAATVGKADQILDAVATERPDLILQDGKMPGLDILSHLKQLRKQFPTLGVVVFTGDIDLRESLAKDAVDAALSKPFDPPELAALIDRLLAERHKRT